MTIKIGQPEARLARLAQATAERAKSGAQWFDILQPTKKDLDWIRKTFHIHPVIIEELKGPSARSRVEAYDHYLYLIYYFPVYDPQEETSRRTEIDFLITKNLPYFSTALAKRSPISEVL